MDPHPLQSQEPDGDRHWISSYPVLKVLTTSGLFRSYFRFYSREFFFRFLLFLVYLISSFARLEQFTFFTSLSLSKLFCKSCYQQRLDDLRWPSLSPSSFSFSSEIVCCICQLNKKAHVRTVKILKSSFCPFFVLSLSLFIKFVNWKPPVRSVKHNCL